MAHHVAVVVHDDVVVIRLPRVSNTAFQHGLVGNLRPFVFVFVSVFFDFLSQGNQFVEIFFRELVDGDQFLSGFFSGAGIRGHDTAEWFGQVGFDERDKTIEVLFPVVDL